MIEWFNNGWWSIDLDALEEAITTEGYSFQDMMDALGLIHFETGNVDGYPLVMSVRKGVFI